jgi:choline-glycine betaine transporter
MQYLIAIYITIALYLTSLLVCIVKAFKEGKIGQAVAGVSLLAFIVGIIVALWRGR